MRAERHDRSGAASRPESGGATTAADPLVGRVLDRRYRIIERIARGGMASVYEAHDLRLDRTVAVKVMHPGMGDDEAFAARFVREARAAARLSHPNVVSVYDQGDDDGTVFLAMEYIPGHTLRDTIAKESPMSPARALAYAEPVLAALAAAHRAGLVHRDVKPENVLMSDDGRVKVADFGLARAVTAETQHTSTGVLIGTVSYLAPELVVEGRSDARADVYSAGVMLYELLTGRKPHTGETPIQVAYKHVHEDVPPPSRAVPGIPPYVDALVARATARDRSLRPADAGVLLHQVHRVANALRAGVADDPVLTEDLALPAVSRAEPTEELRTEPIEVTPWLPPSAPPAPLGPLGPLPAERTTAMRTAQPPPSPPVPAPAPPPATPRRRRWRPVAALVLAVLLVAGLAGGAWWLIDGRYTRAPGVIGLTRAAATARLEQVGLHVAATSAYSDTVAKGRVVSADPGRDEKVPHGGTVRITVSLGVEQYAVPDLAGATADRAEAALARIKMHLGGPVERWSETVAEGRVIRTDPAAGSVLRPGHTVTVYVSKGRQPIRVTDWTHQDADRATRALERRGLNVETEGDYSDSVPEGDVISESPEAGTVLHKGDTVTLLVSKGPPLVEVPGVAGSGVDDATRRLEEAGFKVRIEHYSPYFGLGFVMRQDGAGEKLPRGSTITLWIS